MMMQKLDADETEPEVALRDGQIVDPFTHGHDFPGTRIFALPKSRECVTST
jgi:hypothetical protein